MKINGRQAQSGTIVIGEGQKGTLDLPFGTFDLVFNPSNEPQNVQLTSTPPQIVFDGTDNPLGLTTIMNIPLSNGGSAILNLAAYAIGDGNNTNRIVHYTVVV
jgi:hypothetical protein